ncbi:MAG: DNA-processing protein DprA [Candidatus Methylomirabilales bacterium]
MEEREAWLALNMVRHVGPATFVALLEHFGTARRILKASQRALEGIPGVGPNTAKAIRSFPAEEIVAQERKRVATRGLRFVTLRDPGYPVPLHEIAQPPPVLYVRGSWEDRDRRGVAIVGSRNPTPYGRQVADRLAFDLATRGLTIMSGMARGIDSAAHRAALRAGGRTIAVLGSGADVVYPPEHRKLAEAIAERGALLSEFPLGTGPLKGNFPQRNRLISGLSLGVVVVEAGVDSGALITANHALEQGKEVFAVPGLVTGRLSRGCHRLIKAGAKLTEGWEDVVEELTAMTFYPREVVSPIPSLPPVEGDEARVLRLLGEEPLHIDAVIAGSNLAAPGVAATLLSLEMKGWVKQLSGKTFVRTHEAQ